MRLARAWTEVARAQVGVRRARARIPRRTKGIEGSETSDAAHGEHDCAIRRARLRWCGWEGWTLLQEEGVDDAAAEGPW